MLIKSYDYPFNNENVFIVPINVYDSLITSSKELIESIFKFNSNDLFLSNKLGKVIHYSQINKDIHSSLLDIINSKGYE